MAYASRRQRAAELTPVDETAERTSAVVQAEIEALGAEEAEADALLSRLEGERPDVLLSGDDAAADRHDAALGRARRTIERQNVLHPPKWDALEAELRAVQKREAAAAKAADQASAAAMVQAIVDRVQGGEYDRHAAAIVTLLNDWAIAQGIAVKAGVPTPDDCLRYRVHTLERIAPAVCVPYTAYVDEDGQPTLNEHPYHRDGMMVDRSRVRERATFYREVEPERRVPAVFTRLPSIHALVNLPSIAFDRPAYLNASALRERKAAES